MQMSEKRLDDFKMEYVSYSRVDHSLLKRRLYTDDEINELISLGILELIPDRYKNDPAFANEKCYRVIIK